MVFFNVSWKSWQFVGDGKGREQDLRICRASFRSLVVLSEFDSCCLTRVASSAYQLTICKVK